MASYFGLVLALLSVFLLVKIKLVEEMIKTIKSKTSNRIKVSLTYLRGLEVKQLDVEDLPEL